MTDPRNGIPLSPRYRPVDLGGHHDEACDEWSAYVASRSARCRRARSSPSTTQGRARWASATDEVPHRCVASATATTSTVRSASARRGCARSHWTGCGGYMTIATLATADAAVVRPEVDVPYDLRVMASCASCLLPLPDQRTFLPVVRSGGHGGRRRGTPRRDGRVRGPGRLHGVVGTSRSRTGEAADRCGVRAVDQRHQLLRGRVDKVLGDGIVALFGAPVAHEDDADRAIRAALQMHESLSRFVHDQVDLDDPLRLRIGINTGEVVVGIGVGDRRLHGDGRRGQRGCAAAGTGTAERDVHRRFDLGARLGRDRARTGRRCRCAWPVADRTCVAGRRSTATDCPVSSHDPTGRSSVGRPSASCSRR